MELFDHDSKIGTEETAGPVIKQQKWIFKDRSVTDSAMCGIPISFALLICSFIMVVMYLITWSFEGKILLRVIGFELPLIIKLMSLFSTILLFSFLVHSTGVIYFVVVSCVVYFITHVSAAHTQSLLLSGLLQFYQKFAEYNKPLMDMLYLSQTDYAFFGLLALCLARVIMGIPYSYYALVLFCIRRSGGTGWTKVPAIRAEKESIPQEIKKLEERYEYVALLNRLFGLD